MGSRSERLVYNSDRLRVYERDQTLFDGTEKVFVRAESFGAVYVLPVEGDRILLCYERQPHRKDWYWSHVGGVVERGEDFQLGAKRELLEETGFEAESFQEIRRKKLGGMIKKERAVYLARNMTKLTTPALDLGGEQIELKRVSIETYITMLVEGEISGSSGRREEVMLRVIKHGRQSIIDQLTSK